MLRLQLRNLLLPMSIATAVAATAMPAHADLTLTAAGIADGFSASNFATGLPSGGNYGYGPFGLAVDNNGSGGNNVLVSDYQNSTLYTFNDSDGQTPGSALVTRTSSSGVQGYTSLNGVAYGSNGSSYGTFSSTGVFTAFSIPNLPGPYLGLVGDAATGEILANSNSGLIAINPTTLTFRHVGSVSSGDGLSVSPDGQTVYSEQGGNIYGYNVHTGALVFTAPLPGGAYSPDGTGVIDSTNSLNGDIVANDNYGNLYLIDPTADTIVQIGSNPNQRGDYTSPDYSNGTLLLDYSSEVERLSCGVGCGIGSAPPPNGVPEPASLALLATALAGLGAVRRRSAPAS